ncbi:MAG: DNA polymerase domain-containing protein [Candidatus Woesearchaeota archaeon]
MFVIKKSYGKCECCRLINSPSCIIETNSPENLKDVSVIFIAENPGKEEVKHNPPTPLIGRAGKIFRKQFDFYIKPNFKYAITNSVLCATINKDNTTGNATYEDVDLCRGNFEKLIELCNPELIVIFGNIASYAFGLGKTGIMSRSYQYHTWNNRTIYAFPHPSYLARQQGNIEESKKFESGFKEIKRYLDLKLNRIESNGFCKNTEEEINGLNTEINTDFNAEKRGSENFVSNNKINLTNSEYGYVYKIDKKFYSKDYRLEDVFYQKNFDRVVYVFRDKNNKKIFYEYPKVYDNYYYYQSHSNNSSIIEKRDNLELVLCNYQERKNNSSCYESDVDIAVKHSIDYYLQSQGECEKIKQNILFLDIEVYTFNDKVFPSAEKADYPISLISFAVDDGPIETYLYRIESKIDKNIDTFLKENQDIKITVFTNEKTMLESFVKRLHQLEPTIITAWNVSFDIGYIYNRMGKLGLNRRSISVFDDCYIDPKNHMCLISGYIVLDMMTIYKNFIQNKEESYSLEAVSQKVLKKGKHSFSCSMWELYEKYIGEYIIYNRMDVELIVELNSTLKHIELLDEIRTISFSTWKGSSTTIGQSDGLVLSNLKKKGLCARNRKEIKEKKVIKGAWVKDAIGGKYTWFVDWDFTSLYPNIIRTWNLGPNTYFAKIDEDIAFRLIYDSENIDLESEIDYISDPINKPLKEKKKIKEVIQIIKDSKATINISGCLFKSHDSEKSIFFEIFDYLLETRSLYKKQMFTCKNAKEEKVLDNKQWALKILANSLYGVLLNEYFRFYNPDLGYSITATGQESVKYSGYHLNKYLETGEYNTDKNFQTEIDKKLKYLHYADTDSLFIKIGEYIRDIEKKDEISTNKILEYVKKISPVLNKNILDEFVKKHNIDTKNSYLVLKQEIIADKVYWLNVKKRYALHIINREGHDVDKIDIKGIETQRSDFSQLTKELLKNILNMILLEDEIDIDKIFSYVEERKEMIKILCKERDKRIGKSVSFSKDLVDYKTVSRGVRGMLFWNSLVYPVFVPGTKGIEIPILGIDIDKAPEEVRNNYYSKPYIDIGSKKIPISDLDSIVIPESEEKIPDYIIPNVKEIIKFSVDDRVDLLLEPLIKKSSVILTF